MFYVALAKVKHYFGQGPGANTNHLKYLIIGTDMSIMSIVLYFVLLLIVGSKNSLEKANLEDDIFT